MSSSAIPQDLSDAIAQARSATEAALGAGLGRVAVEIALPELKVMPVAREFLQLFCDRGDRLKVFFPDAGAAALARRDWGPLPIALGDVGSGRTPTTGKIAAEDEIFLFVEASSVEVNQVETLCQEAGDRPVVFLNSRMEDIATIGIGYAGRQLRERFLSTIETVYSLRPIDGGAVRRAYPGPWEVWIEDGATEGTEGGYRLIDQVPQRPAGEVLDEILFRAMGSDRGDATASTGPKRQGFLGQLQGFLRALSQ
jgi:hypothetical protein